MAPKHAAKGHEDALNEESKAALHESKRLQDLAYKGMLSETRRMCTEETMPSKVLLKADGKDITKKSTLRKGRYLLNINAQLAAAAEGRMGALSQLDTKNPVLYIDFPEGRLKFLGTLMFPANKYMVLKFGNRDILCEDVLDCMVVFSEAYWIGAKEENPEEHKMPMPLSIVEAGKKAQEAADAGGAQGTQAAANGTADPVMRAPGSHRKRRAGADQDDSSSGDDDEDDEGGTPAVGRRMSQRSAAKRVKYNVDDSDDDAPSAAEDADADEDDIDDGGFQKLKKQRRVQPAAARRLALQSSQDEASQQEAEPGASSAPEDPAGRRRSMAAASNGHLETVPEEMEDEAEEAHQPAMTQRSTRPCSQNAKDVSQSGGRQAAQRAKRRKLAEIDSDDEDEDEVIDLSSQPSPIPASQSARPRRNASGVKPSLKEASSEDESDEAIEEDDKDEDFLA